MKKQKQKQQQRKSPDELWRMLGDIEAPYVYYFCRQMNCQFKGLFTTEENGRKERAYVFNDGLGYYTIDGIRETLDVEEVGRWN